MLYGAVILRESVFYRNNQLRQCLHLEPPHKYSHASSTETVKVFVSVQIAVDILTLSAPL